MASADASPEHQVPSRPRAPHPHHRGPVPAGLAAPAGRGRPAGQPCSAVPAAPAQGCAVPPAAAGAGARRRRRTSLLGNSARTDSGKLALCRPPRRSIPPRLPPSLPPSRPSPPAVNGASPAEQVAARSPCTLPPRRAVPHRPGLTAQRRPGRCRPTVQRYRRRYRTSAPPAPLPSAWRRRPLPVGAGATHAAAAEPLRAASPSRCGGGGRGGAASRHAWFRAPRPAPVPPLRPSGTARSRRVTAELADCSVGTTASLRAVPAGARGLPDTPSQ